MSKALKCDRCNTCFDPCEVEAPDYFITIPEIFLQNGDEYKNIKTGKRFENQNFCPECSRKYMFFVNGLNFFQQAISAFSKEE